ncbi:EVE domain-containing protein [Rheinheimera sediminis]|uniref:EVE domain-containing protein n=1 Tax=Rheinheimera sp. YQF-1 TaxID=2499626 RepID=UPI000FDC5441|nr:EVE domain-containing protein [Rheinheimera sp. YQF-1]RVT44391.1 EVE domain-containing protein [Rheinheimera sp. YQF-1]
MNYWLFKTEPEECSIDDFAKTPDKAIVWEGVRNYQARNFLRDQVQSGDLVFIYHSSCKDIGIAGVAKVVQNSYPDPSQFNSLSPYFDAKSSGTKAAWVAVDLQFVEKFPQLLSLDKLKESTKLEQLALVKKGNRLSVMPVSPAEWQTILIMAKNQGTT